MKRTIGVALLVVVLAAGGAWWFLGRTGHGSPLGAQPASRLTVSWRGTNRGTMTIPARLNWCPGTRRGILEAISGDSGVAIVMYERDSLTSGAHAVTSPDLAGSIQPPGATVVMRWVRLDRDTSVTGFRSQSGTLRITIVNGTATGDLNVRMQAPPPKTDTLLVQGAFREVPVVTTAAGCS